MLPPRQQEVLSFWCPRSHPNKMDKRCNKTQTLFIYESIKWLVWEAACQTARGIIRRSTRDAPIQTEHPRKMACGGLLCRLEMGWWHPSTVVAWYDMTDWQIAVLAWVFPKNGATLTSSWMLIWAFFSAIWSLNFYGSSWSKKLGGLSQPPDSQMDASEDFVLWWCRWPDWLEGPSWTPQVQAVEPLVGITWNHPEFNSDWWMGSYMVIRTYHYYLKLLVLLGTKSNK